MCELRLRDDGLAATGAQVGAEPAPYRAVYDLEARRGWVTRRLRVEVAGVGSLDLRHDGKGTWAGVENAAELEGVLDCDLAFSPLTNLMPVRRHRLHEQAGAVCRPWCAIGGVAQCAARGGNEHVTDRGACVCVPRP